MDPPDRPEVWFNDGNLVVQAESTRFRIYKGLLVQLSSVFDTLFSLPQPQDQDLVDGCPIIIFQDTADETAYFLKAIYDSSFFEAPPAPTHLNIITSVLRLSTKYDVSYLRRRAILHLDTLYPLSLSTFCNHRRRWTIPRIPGTAFLASTIARDLNLLWLLPSVLYSVCTYSISDVVNGFHASGKLLHLTPTDRDACLQAIPKLASIEHTAILSFLTETEVPACGSPPKCAAAKLTTLRRLNAKRKAFSPLNAFTGQELAYSKLVCSACLAQCKTMYGGPREALWGDLPAIFGLPSWDELGKMQADALSAT